MASVREHYDEPLSRHYSRMFGDFDAKVAEQQSWLEGLGVRASKSGDVAVDLGSGSGFQSIALARLGFRVLAVDFSQPLLAELRTRARGLPIDAIAGNIRDVAALVPGGVDPVVCMGDTLSHLEAADDLTRVFAGAAARLATGGRLILTFRDLTGELRELDRLIPLYCSDDLIMTCFLEYEPVTVKVHDLVWERQVDGWRFHKSAYRKLRLAPDSVIARLERAGFSVERRQAPSGMVALVGRLAL